MDTTTLKIPQTCKVGFNARSDTYSGKLAYVIYKDGNKWRKETSWNSWIQTPGEEISGWDGKKHVKTVVSEDLAPYEFENIPTAGFVLNKKVGGHSNGWNHRNTYCRVFDPRGFEFEIQVPNLLFILQEVESMPGKALSGEFVYSWDGKDLVLLPCSSLDYQASLKFNEFQKQKVSAKELIIGATYLNKSKVELVYLGRLDYCSHEERYCRKGVGYEWDCVTRKEHVFYMPDKDYRPWDKRDHGFMTPAPSSLAECSNPDCHPQFAEILEKYQNSKFAQGYTGFDFKPITINDLERDSYGRWVAKNKGQLFSGDCSVDIINVHESYYNRREEDLKGYRVNSERRYSWNNGVKIASDEKRGYYSSYHDRTIHAKTLEELFEKYNFKQMYLKTTKGSEVLAK